LACSCGAEFLPWTGFFRNQAGSMAVFIFQPDFPQGEVQRGEKKRKIIT
jgi:hypothetical protein